MEESDTLAETHDGHIAGQNTQDINCYPSSRLINSLVQMDKPSCLTIAPNTIKVQWHKCRLSDESLKSYEIIYKKVESELWETTFTDAKDREKDFSNLKEDTQYHFKVRAIFTNSESPYSEISDPVSTSVNRCESSTSLSSCISGQQENSSTTCDDETVDHEHDTYVPVIEDCKSIGKPVCFPLSSDTIKVAWVPFSPLSMNFQSFEIRYKPTIETAKRWHSKFTNGKECEIDIVNLVEETNYCFKVRSIYDDVEGPFSDISDPASTLQISLDLQLNVPGKPMVENITPVTISLKWISPVKTTGAIDCYEIKYKEADTVNKRWISLWTNGTETNILLVGLKDNTSYSIKVRPMIEGEDGPFSVVVTAKTTAKLNRPGIPEKISSTSTQLTITWLEPGGNVTENSHYEIRFREQNVGTKWQSIHTDDWHNKVEVLNLKKKTFYEFKVRAVYGETEGLFSDPVAIISTEPIGANCLIHSTICPTVKVETVTKDTVVLTWEELDCSKGSVDFFEVRYKEIETNKVSSISTAANELNIEIRGLRNETAYEFKVRAITDGEDGIFSMPVKVVTRDVSHNTTFLKFYPPVELNRTAYSIHLQWKSTTINPEKILHYELRYRKQCGSKWLITHTIGNENEINVSKLEANIEYEFKVRPIYENEDGVFSDIKRIWTLPIKDEPQALIAKEVSYNCIKLQWTPSENIQHVDSYDIRYKTSPNGKWSLLTTSETEHTICDLLERTEYEFKVRAIYGDKEGSFSKTIKTSTRCKDQVLSRKFQIEKLHVTDISNNAVTIEWDLPENSPHMQVYEVKYRQRPRGKWYFEEITTNKITLQNLKEASTYQCKVRIFTKGQECRFSDTISVTTTNKNIADENQKPGNPQKEHSTFNIIQIKWKIPVSVRGLRHYDVLYRSFKTEQWIKSTTNENKATINNLEPSSVYEFKVRAVYGNCQGKFSETTSISTIKMESPQTESNIIQPGKPEVISTGYCHAVLRWSISDLKTNNIQYFELQYREFKGRKRGNWESVQTDNNQNEYKLKKLKPSTEYEFRVGAVFVNSIKSPLSAVSDPVLTLTCEMGEVQQKDETHETLTLYWKLPEFGDEVEGYETLYRERLSTVQTWQSAKTSKNEITLVGLREFTEYEVKIRCIMLNGAGGFAEVKSGCKTKMRPIRKYPGQPIEFEVTSRSISITWTPSELPKVDNYEIRYREQGTKTKKWLSVLTEDGSIQFTVIDLKGGTDYEFKVAAIVNGETVAFSEASQKICTKLSLARTIQLDAKQLIDRGPPQRFKLPVVVKTENRVAKTRKCQLDHTSFDLNKNSTYANVSSVQKRGAGFGSKVYSWFKSKPHIPYSLTNAIGLNEKTIMLVGATGSGKSTLIDGMINYITDVSYEDDFRFSLIDVTQDEKKHQGDQTVSQTEWITTYRIPCIRGGKLDYNINIIDTPGFGDTRGIQRDKELVAQVTQLFEARDQNGIQTLDAVCFVTQSPLSRLTQPQLYIFDSILSLFGKDIANNIFALVTFADGKTPPVLDALQKAQIPVKKHFIFNNSALFEANNDDVQKAGFSKMFWKMGEDSFETFFKHLKVVEPKSLQLTADVLQTRMRLEITIEGLQKQVTNGMIQLNTMRQEAEILKRHQGEIKYNTNFNYEVEEVVMTQINLAPGEFVTNCLQCNITCHYPCHIKTDEDKRRCKAMGGKENCHVCPMKCHWTKHRNASFRLEAIPQTVKKTYHELKQKFEIAKKEATNQTAVLQKVKRKFLNLRKDVYGKIVNVQKCINDLDKFALKPNPLSNSEYIDLLIAAEEQELKYGWEERVKILHIFRKEAQMIHEARSGTFQPFKDTDEILKSFDLD